MRYDDEGYARDAGEECPDDGDNGHCRAARPIDQELAWSEEARPAPLLAAGVARPA